MEMDLARKSLGLVAVAAIFLLAAGPLGGARLPTEEALADRILGDPDAPITIVEYSSLTCPHCASFHRDILPELKRDYIDTGKAKLIYRDYPTRPVALAISAAMLARCAPPRRYFGFIELLFRKQESWVSAGNPMESLAMAGQIGGMRRADFEACMRNEDLFQAIRARQQEAWQALGVQSTPTFIINGEHRIVGPEHYDEFRAVLEPLTD